jgi:holo-[acyl-carrier protein] synthase
MIGIGTDILSIERMATALDRTGVRLAHRVLAPEERERIDGTDACALGKAFAAKEAVVKALGTGFRQGIGWHDVRIYRDTLGRPAVTLHGAAEQRLQALGGSQVLLSLSDERDYVVAFAVVS